MAHKTREQISAANAKKAARVISERFKENAHIVVVKYGGPWAAENDRLRWENDSYKVVEITKLSRWKSINRGWLVLGFIVGVLPALFLLLISKNNVLVTYEKKAG